jgi:hypothetical protein
MIEQEWECKTLRVPHPLIARDIAIMIKKGEGIIMKEQPRRLRFPRRLLFLKPKETQNVTPVLPHAAITAKNYDPFRTDKPDFSNATTAPAVAK